MSTSALAMLWAHYGCFCQLLSRWLGCLGLRFAGPARPPLKLVFLKIPNVRFGTVSQDPVTNIKLHSRHSQRGLKGLHEPPFQTRKFLNIASYRLNTKPYTTFKPSKVQLESICCISCIITSLANPALCTSCLSATKIIFDMCT